MSYATIGLAFAQIVFGAIVRISGSGMGCGDHWPKCAGQWFPPHDRMDLIIEISHRYIAALLTLMILSLLGLAFARRKEAGVGGSGGVLNTAITAAGLVVAAALFGAITVKLELQNPYIIVVHLAIAMALLAVLVLAAIRAGGFGSATIAATGNPDEKSASTAGSARAAAGMVFAALVFGALTANVITANGACLGFPWCRATPFDGGPLYIHLTHRIIAFLLLFHTFGMVMAMRKRSAHPIIKRMVRLTFATVLAQIIVAAMLVELHLPPVWRSLHQAVGTLVWLVTITLAILATRAARSSTTTGASAQ